jgi:hypothetical protein
MACDLIIVNVDYTSPTTPGGSDATATVNATSSSPIIDYGISGVKPYQTSNVFTGLSPNVPYNFVALDTQLCRADFIFVIPDNTEVKEYYDSGLPVVGVPLNNISRWNAAFNPVYHKYQRKDFAVTSITQDSTSKIRVVLDSELTPDQFPLTLSDALYLNSPRYDFYGVADSHEVVSGKSNLIIVATYVGDDTTGFLNIPLSKPGYKIETEITAGNDPVYKDVVVSTNTPDKKGYTQADVSPYLQSFLSTKDLYDYLATNYKDYNLAGSYTVRYREVWDTASSAWRYASYPLYYTFASFQLQEKNGGNLAGCVPFMTTELNSDKAKWITDFERPTLTIGLPFEMSFIYSENIINEKVYLEITPDVGSNYEGLLVNPDGGYITSADTGRLKIERIKNPLIDGFPIVQQLGLNRVLIPQGSLQAARSAVIKLYYLSGTTRVYFMQPITINVFHPCNNDPYVYLKWINHLGAWDYWRFGHNQALSSSTTNSEKVNRFVSDWANDDTINDYISRNANDKMQLLTPQVNASDLKALRWLSKSIKCQMLTSTNPVRWQTVLIPDADFPALNTRTGKADIKFNITLPQNNIQNQ